ncbi:MAG: hypothetical protein IAE93_12900 [Ignavibacteria bacterium]|nr:hypothetical protein [Ignavibacteria bacterium]
MFKEFFREVNGNYSMTRLTTFILVITSVLLAGVCGWLVISGKLITELTYLIGVLLGFGLGSKVSQKFAERNTEITKE